MFRKMIKTCLASFLYKSKFKRNEGSGDTCRILMYHRVCPFDKPRDEMPEWLKIKSLPGIVVSPEMFEEQMQFLRENYNIISLGELAASMNQDKGISPDSVAITFDDGWRDNYEYAFPILKKYSIPATIFLSTGYIGTNRIFWPEMLIYSLTYHSEQCKSNLLKLSRQDQSIIYNQLHRIIATKDKKGHPLFNHLIEQLKQIKPDERKNIIDTMASVIELNSDDMRVMMNWDEVMEMSKQGVNFGSHGVEHEILTHLNPDEISAELEKSRQTIIDKLSLNELAFAYPNGNFDDNIKKMVQDSGYICAVSTKTGKASGTSDRYALERINVHQDNSSGLNGIFSKALFAYHIDLRF